MCARNNCYEVLYVDPYEYVDYYFKADTFRVYYSHSIPPIIQNSDDLPDDDEVPLLFPPKTKNHPGRPWTKRFKLSGKVGKTKYRICGQMSDTTGVLVLRKFSFFPY